MRVGVLGGSFNPPHIGHLILASDAFEALQLDRLIVVPANANPLKGLDPLAPRPEQRLDMARLAFGGDPRFEVSSVEIDRGGLSFMVDTLEALAAEHEGAELVLLLGIDSLMTLDRWKEPQRIKELATLAGLKRGAEAAVTRGAEAAHAEAHDAEAQSSFQQFEVVTTRRVDVSSTEIRERIAAGLPVKGFVAESVEAYISAAKLYRQRAED
ncbi:MAG: nicotinate-nucleotide adenylyltransferase [Gemmatimonadaceae bacterium]